jgi:hypothetical protein
MIVHFVGAGPGVSSSKLYDAAFSHGYREAKTP